MATFDTSLAGHVALVTGASSGIGKAAAVALGAAGAKLAVNHLESERAAADDVVRAIEEQGGTAAAFAADVSSEADVAALVERVVARFGTVHVLVNNAGIQHVAPIEAFPPEKWDAILAINLSSAFHTIRAALPGMREKGWGRIINTASTHGLIASPGKSAYTAAKHGIVGLTKAVALEAAGSGVTCNAICPGWVLTPLVQKQVEARAAADGIDEAEAKRRLLAEKQPSGAFVTTEQIGALAGYLCSDAAAQITGAALNVDGGWLAQ